MKLRALRVRNVGPFGEEGCVLEGISDGLNVVREGNETGKSTLYRALKLILFEAHNSKKQYIKDFRCDRGTGFPYVELDVEIDGKSYRLIKQYLSRELAAVIDPVTNRRIAEKKDAEAWIAERLGSDKIETSAPGLLWVGQGDSLIQPSSEPGAGQALFDSLEGEIETVVGGEHANVVLERAKSELSGFVTNTGKPRAQFKEVGENAARLREEENQLTQQVRDSEEFRQELVDVEKKLERLSGESEAEHHLALEQAQKALNVANSAEEKLNGLRLAKGEASAAEIITRKDLEAFRARISELVDLSEKHSATTQEADAVRREADDLDESLKVDRIRVDGLKQAYLDAKQTLAEAEKTAEKIEANKQFQSIDEALGKAREISRQLQISRNEASVELPDLANIENAHEELIRCRTSAQAARPSLLVESATAPVILNDEAISDEEPVLMSGRSRLTYRDLRLVIETPDNEGMENALATAEESLNGLLAECGAENVAKARGIYDKRDRANETVKRLMGELDNIAPEGIAALEAERDALDTKRQVDVDEFEPPDLSALSAQRNEAETAWSQSKGELDVAETALRDKRAETRTLEDRARGFYNQIEPIEQILGPAEERGREERRLVALNSEAADKTERASKDFEAAERDLPSVEAAQARVQRLEDAARNRSQDRTRLSERRGQLSGQLKQAGQDGAEEKLADVKAERERLESREVAFRRESEALSLLVEEVEKATSERRQKYFQPVKEVVNPLISQVLGNASISFDDNLGPATIERDGLDESLSRLSGGTQEQIAVLTRLGFAKVMAEQGIHVPVVLDDALVFSDDERIQKMFDMINLVASEVQVIAFSCRQKTFEELGGNHIHARKFKREIEST